MHAMTHDLCLLCGGPLYESSLVFAQQPVTKNLLDEGSEDAFKENIELTICTHCATVQQPNPWPYHVFVPSHDWMTFREPEDHLDHAVEQVIASGSLNSSAVVWGLSSKDDTTLERFEKLGFRRTYRVSPSADLNIDTPHAYIECVQHGLTVETAKNIVAAHGHTDCLIARHILEHAERPRVFLAALREMIQPDGVVVIEVPDCSTAFAQHDCLAVWEEHSLYFTPQTLQHSFCENGFEVFWSSVYPYAFENSIVLAARKTDNRPKGSSSHTTEHDLQQFRSFCEAVPAIRRNVNGVLRSKRSQGRSIVLFGAGHLGCSFVNYFGAGDMIEFAVDDAPQKRGLKLPGSNLTIRPSSELAGIDNLFCLLSVTPDKEDAVVQRLKSELDSGVEYASVFTASERFVGTLA